ncbi:caspase family protein [Algivirga pacifica]|uniref:Peptidase C14 caspase domain-containing protein n=1 Tax=Algivirga pacifica TaxID=1162670 RepID=A0ABP9D318_9BACT
MRSTNKQLPLLYFLFLLLSATTLKAQTFHAIMFADTADPSIGSSCLTDYERMEVEFATIANANGMKIKRYFHEGTSFTKETIQKVLKEELACGPNDVVYFYYTGHGARSADDQSKWPQLSLGLRKTNASHYPLAFVNDLIKEKNPKFSIVMADCCNEVIKGLSVKKARGGVSIVEDIDESFDVYENLFLLPKGNIIVTSSSPGEQALGNDKGGIYTNSFLEALQKSVIMATPVTWDGLMNDAKKMTMERSASEKMFTPQFEINLEEEQPEELVAEVEPKVVKQEEPLTPMEMIAQLYDYNKSRGERIRLLSKVLNDVFASPNARIQVFGLDGNTMLDRYTAADFVKKLATSTNLARVIEIRSETTEDGKYTSMDIHEYYERKSK